MSNMPWLKLRALDDNGTPIAGAKLYFYEANATSVLQDTYADKARTSANANPMIADGDGYFGRIYLEPLTGYRVLLKNASDVLIWDEDDVEALDVDEAVIGSAISPLSYGAVGDGATNDATALQNAINAALGSSGAVVDLGGKTYRCDSALSFTSDDVTMQNGTIDFSQSASPGSSNIVIAGSDGNTTALTANALAEATSVAVSSASGLAENDWLWLNSNDTWSGLIKTGEMVRISSVAGLTVNLTEQIINTYNTASGASVTEIRTIKNITLRNLKLIGSPSAAGNENIIKISKAEGITLSNVSIIGAKIAAVGIAQSANVRVLDCVIDCDQLGVTTAYPVRVHDFARDIWFDRTVFSRAESVLVGLNDSRSGLVVDCVFSDCIFSSCKFLNIGSAHRVTVRDCRFIDGYIVLDTAAGSVGIYGNTIRNTIASNEAIVSNCAVTSSGVETLGYDIANNNIYLGGSAGIGVSIGHGSASPAIGLSVCNNRIRCDSGASIGIHISSVHGNTVITGNQVLNTVTAGINFAVTALGTNQVVISNNTVITADGVALQALVSSSDGQASIVGNTLSTAGTDAADRAADISSIDQLCFVGNSCRRANDAGSCVRYNMSGVADGVFSGNSFYNGTYGLEILNGVAADLLHDGNVFGGQSTGTVTGTITAGDSA